MKIEVNEKTGKGGAQEMDFSILNFGNGIATTLRLSVFEALR